MIFKKNTSSILLNRKARILLLQELNKIRIKGNIFINDFNFYNIGECLKSCLNIIMKENSNEFVDENAENDLDYESINMIFIIATNLYKMNEYGNKPRLFLQESLVDTPIFGDFNFWKKIIRYFIINEMHTQKNYNIYETKEVKEERKKKIN